jgi:hypothetical protein
MLEEILTQMKKIVDENQVVNPAQWLDYAVRLNILKDEIEQRFYILEHNLAIKKKQLIEKDMTVAKAESYIKADEEYLKMNLIKGKIKMIDDFIKLAKKYATIQSDNIYNG